MKVIVRSITGVRDAVSDRAKVDMLKAKVEAFLNTNIHSLIEEIGKDAKRLLEGRDELCTPGSIASKLVSLDLDLRGEIIQDLPPTWSVDELEPITFKVDKHRLYVELMLPTNYRMWLEGDLCGSAWDVKKDYLDAFNALRSELSNIMMKYVMEAAEQIINDLDDKLEKANKRINELEYENDRLRRENVLLRQILYEIHHILESKVSEQEDDP